jgi:AraC-like DNA-binding protein
MIFWSFFVRLEHLLPLFDGNEISLLQEIAGHFKDSKLFPSSTALAMKCHRLIEDVPPQFDLEHRSHLLRLVAVILDEEFRTAHHKRVGLGQVEERIIQIFEQLSADQLLEHSVDELAAKFGCGRRHLNRLFNQFFGFSVGALRMEMRLQKAASLLRDTNAKVINVAAQCGFNHLGLFNTCFKKRFGISPGRWCKQTATGRPQPATVPRCDSACPLQVKGLCPLLAGTSETGVPMASTISPAGKPPGTTPCARALPGRRAGGSQRSNINRGALFPSRAIPCV